MSYALEIEDDDAGYSAQVGERLRSIRKQKRLSLHDVEAQSTQEFKASVLGAYERGERALSLPRLDRLAQFYRVPVDQPRHPLPLPARLRRRTQALSATVLSTTALSTTVTDSPMPQRNGADHR